LIYDEIKNREEPNVADGWELRSANWREGGGGGVCLCAVVAVAMILNRCCRRHRSQLWTWLMCVSKGGFFLRWRW